jgi:hypothetical protein
VSATPNLDKLLTAGKLSGPDVAGILDFAQAWGFSQVPRHLMPAGFTAELAGEDQTDEVPLVSVQSASFQGRSIMPSHGGVKAYERISHLTGRIEQVHAYERDDRIRPGIIGGQMARNELKGFYGQNPAQEAQFRLHLRTARGHLEAGRHDEAIEALERARGIAHARSFGLVHSELGQHQDAVRAHKAAAEGAAAAEHARRSAEVEHAPVGKKGFRFFRQGAKPVFATADAEGTIGLAQVNVKGFERVVRGKVEEVRPFSEERKGGMLHPESVGTHKVVGVFEHPESKHALYDLGHGLHAEGKPGGKPGPVMKSATGLDKAALKEKGWQHTKPPAAKAAAPKPPAPRELKPREKMTAKGARIQHGLAQQQQEYMARAGYKVDPKDWKQDWVPQHEDRIAPDLQPSGDVKDLSKPGRADGTGTASDPIDVKGNIQEALRQLAAGKHVRLNKPTELTLIMQAVQRHAAETEAAGKNDKPDWDFGRLSVKGTNLFAAQNKGIRRINMPQFSGLAQPGTHAEKVAGGAGKFADLTDEFEQHLRDKGIKVERATVPAAMLKSTQSELVGAKVAGFANAFLHGDPKAVKAMSEPIMVTKDGYVVDGHHRWGANMLVDAVDGRLASDTPMNVRRVDMEIGAMIPMANAWAQQVGIAPAAAVAGDTGPGAKPAAKAVAKPAVKAAGGALAKVASAAKSPAPAVKKAATPGKA